MNEVLNIRRRPQPRIDLIHALRQLAHARLHHVHAAGRRIQLARQQIELAGEAGATLREQSEFGGDTFQLCAACVAPVQAGDGRPGGEEPEFHCAAPFAARPPAGGQK
jgi:hypothetical protein